MKPSLWGGCLFLIIFLNDYSLPAGISFDSQTRYGSHFTDYSRVHDYQTENLDECMQHKMVWALFSHQGRDGSES